MPERVKYRLKTGFGEVSCEYPYAIIPPSRTFPLTFDLIIPFERVMGISEEVRVKAIRYAIELELISGGFTNIKWENKTINELYQKRIEEEPEKVKIKIGANKIGVIISITPMVIIALFFIFLLIKFPKLLHFTTFLILVGVIKVCYMVLPERFSFPDDISWASINYEEEKVKAFIKIKKIYQIEKDGIENYYDSETPLYQDSDPITKETVFDIETPDSLKEELY